MCGRGKDITVYGVGGGPSTVKAVWCINTAVVFNYCTVEQEVNKKYQKQKKAGRPCLSHITAALMQWGNLTISFAHWSM
jgi:hypothetical protein